MQMIRLVVVFPLRCGCTVNPLTIAVIFGQLTGPGEPGLPVRMVWILLLLCSVAFAYTPEEPLLFDSFPDDFLWGSATAAYQVNLTKITPYIQGVFFLTGTPPKSSKLARLGVSRPIYVNVDSPNLGFPYFNFLKKNTL